MIDQVQNIIVIDVPNNAHLISSNEQYSFDSVQFQNVEDVVIDNDIVSTFYLCKYWYPTKTAIIYHYKYKYNKICFIFI